jgi:hypothetical protein
VSPLTTQHSCRTGKMNGDGHPYKLSTGQKPGTDEFQRTGECFTALSSVINLWLIKSGFSVTLPDTNVPIGDTGIYLIITAHWYHLSDSVSSTAMISNTMLCPNVSSQVHP